MSAITLSTSGLKDKGRQQCLECGQSITQKRGPGRKREFCSEGCKKAFGRKSTEKNRNTFLA